MKAAIAACIVGLGLAGCSSNRRYYAPSRKFISTHQCHVETEVPPSTRWEPVDQKLTLDNYTLTAWLCDGVSGYLYVRTDGDKGWRP